MSRSARRGVLLRVRPGLYADADEWTGLAPWDRYAARVLAAATTLTDPVFAYESAAVVHGLPTFGEPRLLHASTSTGRGYRRGDLVVHAGEPRAFERVDGILVTALLDTVGDLIRVLPHAHAVAVLDAALRRGVDAGALRRLLAVQPSSRGMRRAQSVLGAADARAESPFESVSRVTITALGFDRPELQACFELPHGEARADFWWPRERIIGEADGRGKYGETAETSAEAVWRERRREVELLRQVAHVARWEWSDVTTPARLDAILRAAGVPRIQPAMPDLSRFLFSPRR